MIDMRVSRLRPTCLVALSLLIAAAPAVAGERVVSIDGGEAPLYGALELPALFRPGVQPYLVSWLPIDPAVELKEVRAPVLILQGGHDLQISGADAARLAQARPDATTLTLGTANHVLKDAPAERAATMAAYADPTRPLDPQVVPAVAAFTKRIGPAR